MPISAGFTNQSLSDYTRLKTSVSKNPRNVELTGSVGSPCSGELTVIVLVAAS